MCGLFSVNRDLSGIFLDEAIAWEVSPPQCGPDFFAALKSLLPAQSYLYVENPLEHSVEQCLVSREVRAPSKVRIGTIWPAPCGYHAVARPELLDELARLAESLAKEDMCIHLVAYQGGKVLVSWYDAWTDPMWLSQRFREDEIAAFAEQMGSTYARLYAGRHTDSQGERKVRRCGFNEDFVDADLGAADFRDMVFPCNMDFSRARLCQADFTGARFRRWVDFEGADLSGASFENCTMDFVGMDNARLHGAVLEGVSPNGFTWMGADFTGANLRHADLYGGIAHCAIFRDADLTGAQCRGVDFCGADFSGARLKGANLGPDNLKGRTHLGGANLAEAILGDCRLAGAVYDSATRFPKGFNPEEHGMVFQGESLWRVARKVVSGIFGRGQH